MGSMPGSWPPADHPALTDDTYTITSPNARRYNCIAWAAGNDTNWWWPDNRGIGKWPQGIPRAVTMEAFVAVFQSLGYSLCYSSALELGIEKIAIYAKRDPITGNLIPTHAARQLESGHWTSKMGPLEDITHETADDVNGRLYGSPVYYMARQRP